MFYRGGQGEEAIPWQQVKAIEQDAYNLYFLLAANGPLARRFTSSYRNMKGVRLFLNRVCIAPKQAFADPLQAATFFDLATTFRGNAGLLPQRATPAGRLPG